MNLTALRPTQPKYLDGVWLGKPRGLYLWTVEFRPVASFLRRVAWQISRQRRVKGCSDAVWPLPPPLTCELFTSTTRETIDALTSLPATLETSSEQ
ncbi:hypothetical protein AVEN_92955-1 [Araneus ventricosus]|uniref:Uncharacterized protein n=1 Tax=Araneus ventricosus TaxID=182803 RepID=A0A4Y2WE31_ARAVE|nr:hypothetical protein AVEN_92955-1 [Araneus ventricosus]